MKRKVFCTSTGCLEYAPQRYREMGIGIIRIHVLFEGKEYLEGIDLDPVEFYEKFLIRLSQLLVDCSDADMFMFIMP